MSKIAIFHGTLEESYQLAAAIQNNCICPQRCDAHLAMLDQRFCNGILFARFIRAQLQCEEHQVADSLVSNRRRPARSV